VVIGKIRHLIAVAVGVACLVATAGRVDRTGALSSADPSGRGDGAAATLAMRSRTGR